MEQSRRRQVAVNLREKEKRCSISQMGRVLGLNERLKPSLGICIPIQLSQVVDPGYLPNQGKTRWNFC
jgi:hypothetical protein